MEHPNDDDKTVSQMLHSRVKSPSSDENAFQGDSSQILTLSLFIILLAFFIVMNGVSGYETNKVSETLESIDLAFAGRVVGRDAPLPSVTQGEDKSTGEGESQELDEALSAMFNVELPNILPEFENDGTGSSVMTLTVDREMFISKFGAIAPKLGDLLTKRNPGERYHVYLLFEVNDPQALNSRDVRSLDYYAKAFVRSGVDDDFMSIGTIKGKSNKVRLVFEVRKQNKLF